MAGFIKSAQLEQGVSKPALTRVYYNVNVHMQMSIPI